MVERSIPTLDQWWDQVTAALGIAEAAPSALMSQVLDLTRDVAHGVSRPAAPLTAFLVGVAVGAGSDPQEATRAVTALLAEVPHQA
jgi:Domain of unknown function (DUF6457)